MNRRRIAIGVSSVSGLAVVAAGAMSMVGSGHSTHAVDLHAAPVAAVSGAPGATRQAGTAQVDTVVTVLSPAVPAHGNKPATPQESLTMHGSGLFDFGRQIGSIDLTVPSGTLNEVLTPATVYLRRGAIAATPTAAAVPASVWTSMPTAKDSDGDVISGGATAPGLVFAMLGGVQPGVRYVGQDVVRGVPVVHYQGTLDLAQAAAALPGAASAKGAASGARSAAAPADAADKQALTNAAHAFTTTKVPFEAYLDAQGRLRRFVGTFSFLANSLHQVDQATSATEFYGFGAPVTVVAPTGAVPESGGAGAVPRTENSAARRPTTPSTHPTSPTRTHK